MNTLLTILASTQGIQFEWIVVIVLIVLALAVILIVAAVVTGIYAARGMRLLVTRRRK